MPISIPSQLKQKGKPSEQDNDTGVFVPPHQLSQRDPSQLMEGSLPFANSARLRNRDLVLRSTGFLPKTHTSGFSLARTVSLHQQRKSTADDQSGRISAAGVSAPLQRHDSASGQLAGHFKAQPSSGTGAHERTHNAQAGGQRLTAAALAPLDEVGSAPDSLRSIAQSVRSRAAAASSEA